MKGEIWKPVKGYEEYYVVSNLGRVKRLETLKVYMRYGKTIETLLHEKIVPQTASFRLNKHINKTLCAGIKLILRVKKITVHTHVSRLVYEAFTGKIPEKGIIQHKDNDPQNNRVENLYLSTRSMLTHKLHEEGRSNLFYSVLGVKHSAERIARHSSARSMEVSQYDIQGNRVATYKSLKEASKHTNISHSTISCVLSGKNYIAGGFVWRTGKKPWIDLSELLQKRFLSRSNNCHAVCQYTVEGKLLATYRSIAEACRLSGISQWYITQSIQSKPVRSEYIWRSQKKNR
ncbi:MAG: NUMOD1 domain-containing DNA-binding protein [Dysgonomonas sp.]